MDTLVPKQRARERERNQHIMVTDCLRNEVVKEKTWILWITKLIKVTLCFCCGPSEQGWGTELTSGMTSKCWIVNFRTVGNISELVDLNNDLLHGMSAQRSYPIMNHQLTCSDSSPSAPPLIQTLPHLPLLSDSMGDHLFSFQNTLV